MADPALPAGVVRALGLLLPIAAVGGLVAWRRPTRSTWGGVLLATVWALLGVLALHLVAQRAHWWEFHTAGGEAFGIPVDLLIGWALLWGAIPLLALPSGPVVVPIAAIALVDVAFMPLLEPAVVLGPDWLVGEAVGLATVMVPALLLGRWMADDRRLGARASLQFVLAGGVVMWALPALALDRPGGLVDVVAGLSPSAGRAVLAGLALAALPGVAAVQELAERGGGTPLPLDPPRRLVTSGPYAYCRNPMQTSVTAILGLSSVAAGSWRLAAAAVVSVAYSAGFAAWQEHEELAARYGDAWLAYRRSVRPWCVRRRPYAAPQEATIWVAAGCDQCSSLAAFLHAKRATALAVRPAEEHPSRTLRRITYEADGRSWDGVAAIARALGHLHFGWAFAGWILRLPLLVDLVQLLVDAAGGGPRDLPAPDAAGVSQPAPGSSRSRPA